ncbi:hypothetical protein FisN_10Lu412 [Fistulifera solaris]|uniref:Uncharacterized protein n=1 Tax=Fistulifera solaris TaxID=1519565 RepID=A0A1Z5JV27_FISSO|nr:hypothetical protein FisN_10Lu412 [Fistulifera solaris]|eukprot:GAX17692.1 hypothetical protein FisN_10Lu412 [Fistulifera solaris]
MFTIFGTTDAAIAETATFFWSLKHIGRNQNAAGAAGSDLGCESQRVVSLQTGTWNTQQSVIVATRAHHLRLSSSYGYFALKDGRTVFVDALATRQASFGSLAIECDAEDMPFCRDNLKRLLQLDVLEKLAIRSVGEECALMPLSAKVHILDYNIQSKDVDSDDFDSLEIFAKDITLSVDDDNLINSLEAFLDRVAELGHLERLYLCASSKWEDEEDMRYMNSVDLSRVADSLVDAIDANPQLTVLDISSLDRYIDLVSHTRDIYEAVERHSGLRTFAIHAWHFEDFEYDALEQLLSRNRDITVVDITGHIITNHTTIDAIYQLNRLYHGSPKLVQEPTAVRPCLVGMALVEKASMRFPCTAILLSDHIDVLCEFVGRLNDDNAAAIASGTEKINRSPSKRKMRSQPSHAVKKAAKSLV